MFNVYLAQNLAQVRISEAEATRDDDGNFIVSMTVTNEGGIPTALEMAQRVKIVREDVCSIQLSPGQGFVVVSTNQGGGRGGFAGRGGRGRGGRGGDPNTGPRASTEIGWLQPGETRTVSWTVAGAGTVVLEIGSTRGGVDRRTLDLR
jgi:hypothetical protein